MKRLTFLGCAAAAALAGCASDRESVGPVANVPQAAAVTAELRNAAGMSQARATVQEVGDSLRVVIEALHMAPGAYGAHIHAVGRCDAPGFTTAGPHWNPTGQKHGKDNPQGMHKGDLPNLLVGTDGRGSFEYSVPNATLGGGAAALMDGDGAAVVIHQQADDYRTDPSGNSGARIACGVLG